MRSVVAILFVCLSLHAPAVARAQPAPDPVGDAIISQLDQLGYDRIEMSRTLLGRVRVIGERDDRRREIVANPLTGEILRDLVTRKRSYAAENPNRGERQAQGEASARSEKEADISISRDLGDEPQIEITDVIP
ncbi:hypothetical protein [Paracoccus sp. (in: a-proteobacteria)]|uniref:hypothetical protein n=1 Tax=Paracoccus sp. TaxID=267 RepID=UPI003A88CDDD